MATNANEEEILQSQLRFSNAKATFLSLYRYATPWDIVLVIFSALCALIAGACQPLLTIVFARIAAILVHFEDAKDRQANTAAVLNHYTLFFVYIAIAAFVMHYLGTAGFIYTGEKITRKIREEYMAAVLKQNMAVFDEQGAGDIITQLSSDTNLIQDGISQKLGLTLNHVGVLLATYIISFSFYWKLTFILTWPVALGKILLVGGEHYAVKYSEQSLTAYSAGGAVVEEAFGSIKSTIALGMQQNVIDRYTHFLELAEKSGFLLKSFVQSLTAFAIGACWLNVALSLWRGSHFLVDGATSFTAIVTITLSTKTSAFSVLGIGAHIGAFTSAVASAGKIFAMIQRDSPIDPTSENGLIPEEFIGAIEFRDIKHIYPSRADVVVAESLNITFPPRKTTAVVGSSGSGKSTIVNLLERFYTPMRGQVLLDGKNIQNLNLQWWRRQIGLINQEPTLFDTTIAQNIEYGLVGTQHENAPEEKKREMVIAAATLACADTFIAGLPQGYETMVGPRGSKLSGGQKQRIAIARAMIAEPRILILDEATSALDSKTESKVQEALNASMAGRTTIIVAHRLSTVKNADNIIVLDKGKIVEQGTHDDMMRAEGPYFRLVEAQAQEDSQEDAVLSLHKSSSDFDNRIPIKTDLGQPAWKTPKTLELEVHDSFGRIDASDQNYSLWSLLKFAAAFNLKEAWIVFVGLVCSAIAGCEEPVAAILLGEAIVAISLQSNENNHLISRAAFWSLMFLVLALVQWFVFTVQGIAFAYCSERLIFRARDQALQSILNQDAAFFDHKENSAGSLASFLSTEATQLSSISGAAFGTMLTAVSTLVAAFIVGCIYGWKLALVCSSVIPVLVGCGILGVWFVDEVHQKMEQFNQISTTYASEAISAIQSISALTRQKAVLDYFTGSLAHAGRDSLKNNLCTSFLWALSQSLLYACMALGFWYGETLILQTEYSFLQFIIVYNSVIMSAFSAGLIFEFTPEMGKSKKSASSLKRLLEAQSTVDPRSKEGVIPERFQGKIDFQNISFCYPSRPQHLVLDEISFTVFPGQHVALVGETGCGKSTIVSLLERFYNPLSGNILVDNIPIASLNISAFRRAMGLVIQEPTLYSGTIRENLLMGLVGESITDADIESACRDAHIYDFIMSLPQGFQTQVGNRGSQMSGGQKQRVALARALLRNPPILLLDEATSAVDSQSEALIQAALAKVTQGRTTITIAHRLSTVRKADVILVMDAGRIVERGHHEELLRRKGRYWALYGIDGIPT